MEEFLGEDAALRLCSHLSFLCPRYLWVVSIPTSRGKIFDKGLNRPILEFMKL